MGTEFGSLPGSLLRECSTSNVGLGSNSEVGARNRDVRFPPDSDQTADIAGGPVRANSGLMHRNKNSLSVVQPGEQCLGFL